MYKLLKIDQLDFPLQVLKVLEKSATPSQYSKGPAWSTAVQKIVSMFGAHIHLGWMMMMLMLMMMVLMLITNKFRAHHIHVDEDGLISIDMKHCHHFLCRA